MISNFYTHRMTYCYHESFSAKDDILHTNERLLPRSPILFVQTSEDMPPPRTFQQLPSHGGTFLCFDWSEGIDVSSEI